jgi:hypothetical protein
VLGVEEARDHRRVVHPQVRERGGDGRRRFLGELHDDVDVDRRARSPGVAVGGVGADEHVPHPGLLEHGGDVPGSDRSLLHAGELYPQ